VLTRCARAVFNRDFALIEQNDEVGLWIGGGLPSCEILLDPGWKRVNGTREGKDKDPTQDAAEP
jgi:hypothetical protein